MVSCSLWGMRSQLMSIRIATPSLELPARSVALAIEFCLLVCSLRSTYYEHQLMVVATLIRLRRKTVGSGLLSSWLAVASPCARRKHSSLKSLLINA